MTFYVLGLLVITRQLLHSWWLLHIWNFFVRKLSLWVLFALLFSQLISAEKARDEAQGELAKYTEVTITSWIAVGNQLEKLCLKLFCLFLLFLGHARATGSKRSVGVWTGRNVTVVCKLIVTCLIIHVKVLGKGHLKFQFFTLLIMWCNLEDFGNPFDLNTALCGAYEQLKSVWFEYCICRRGGLECEGIHCTS